MHLDGEAKIAKVTNYFAYDYRSDTSTGRGMRRRPRTTSVPVDQRATGSRVAVCLRAIQLRFSNLNAALIGPRTSSGAGQTGALCVGRGVGRS